MFDRAHRLGLAVAPLDEPRFGRERGPHDLYCDIAVEVAVVRAEDVGHAAASDAVRKLVAAADQAHDELSVQAGCRPADTSHPWGLRQQRARRRADVSAG